MSTRLYDSQDDDRLSVVESSLYDWATLTSMEALGCFNDVEAKAWSDGKYRTMNILSLETSWHLSILLNFSYPSRNTESPYNCDHAGRSVGRTINKSMDSNHGISELVIQVSSVTPF